MRSWQRSPPPPNRRPALTRFSLAAARRRCCRPTRSRASSMRAGARSPSRRTARSRSRPIRRRVSLASLEGYLAAGVNRLSFGVQSFRDDELKRLGRLHSARHARSTRWRWRGRPASTTSASTLMMWLPEQRVDEWLASVDALDRGESRSRVALPAGALSERAAAGGHGAGRLVAGAGRRMRRRCTSRGWRGWTPPATSSTRSPTSRARAGRRATTSNTGRTASGSGSAAAHIPRATASAGATLLLPWSTCGGSPGAKSVVADRRVLGAEEQCRGRAVHWASG